MDIISDFDAIFFINLGRREDRRNEVIAELSIRNIDAKRFPAIDCEQYQDKWKRVEISADGQFSYRGYESPARYCLALTKRLLIRSAQRAGLRSVLMLEDDVVIHPNIHALAGTIQLPDDWGILFLGCAHTVKPTWVSQRLVKVKCAVDNHAIAIRSSHFTAAIRVMNRAGKSELDLPGASDRYIASLAERVPSYACYPNLAWQRRSSSDLLGIKYSNYTIDGDQTWSTDATEGLIEKALGIPAIVDDKIKVAFLFLTRGDVNHPDVWEEYFSGFEGRYKILCHTQSLDDLEGGFLHGSAICSPIATEWGDVSLVRATNLLIKEALQDTEITHCVLLSESCVPIKPFAQLIRHLSLDPRSMFRSMGYHDGTEKHRSRVVGIRQIPRDCWRFQSQWWLMNRVAASIASGSDFTSLFENTLAPDEFYYATVLRLQGYPIDDRVNNRPVTWVKWQKEQGRPIEWVEIDRKTFVELTNTGAYFARKFTPASDISKLKMHI